MAECREKVSEFSPVVSCVNPTSAFRYQVQSGTARHGLVRNYVSKKAILTLSEIKMRSNMKRCAASVSVRTNSKQILKYISLLIATTGQKKKLNNNGTDQNKTKAGGYEEQGIKSLGKVLQSRKWRTKGSLK